MPTYILVRLSFPERKVCLVSCSLHVTKYATTPTNYVSSLHPKSKKEEKKKTSFELFISFKQILSSCTLSYREEKIFTTW